MHWLQDATLHRRSINKVLIIFFARLRFTVTQMVYLVWRRSRSMWCVCFEVGFISSGLYLMGSFWRWALSGVQTGNNLEILPWARCATSKVLELGGNATVNTAEFTRAEKESGLPRLLLPWYRNKRKKAAQKGHLSCFASIWKDGRLERQWRRFC